MLIYTQNMMHKMTYKWEKNKTLYLSWKPINHLSSVSCVHSTLLWVRWRLTVRCWSWWPRPKLRSWRKSRTIERKERRTTPWSWLGYQPLIFSSFLSFRFLLCHCLQRESGPLMCTWFALTRPIMGHSVKWNEMEAHAHNCRKALPPAHAPLSRKAHAFGPKYPLPLLLKYFFLLTALNSIFSANRTFLPKAWRSVLQRPFINPSRVWG